MKLKRYKPLIFQLGILLLICAIFIFILERQKKFITIDFSKQYAKNQTVELASFEPGETWRGNYSYDSQRVLEGKSSITFSSWYGAKNTIVKEEVTKISEGYVKGYVSLFIPDVKNVNAIEVFELGLSEATGKEKVYNLTPLLHVGWNRVPWVAPDWKSITSSSLTLISKAGEIAEVNLDRMWIENTSFYTSDVFTTKSSALSLRTIGDRTYLYSATPQRELYTLSAPQIITNGSVTLSLIPEHAGEVQLLINGGSMKISGKNMNECSLFQNSEKPVIKMLQKMSGKNDLYLFIKADVSGKNVTYSISNNGVDYEECGAIQGAQKQPIQLSLQGSYLLDSYAAEY